MIAHRMAWQVARGRLQDLVELTKSVAEWSGFIEKDPGRWRAYTSYIGPMDAFVLELEFDDFVQFEEFWGSYMSNPKTHEHWMKWSECTIRELDSEVWHLVEHD